MAAFRRWGLLVSLAAAPCVWGQTPYTRDTGALPAWLALTYEQRTRYEAIDRRYGDDPSPDQQIPVRHRARVETDFGRVSCLLELQHTSVRLADAGSIVTSAQVGATPLVQAHAVFRPFARLAISAGRISPDFGSRRLIARNLYRNTTNAFDGVLAAWKPARWELRAFAFRPAVFTGLRNEQVRVDGLLAGAFAQRAVSQDAVVEGYLYRFSDSRHSATGLHRKLWTAGSRYLRPAAARRADFEFEGVLQGGHTQDLSKRAYMTHEHAGYSFSGTLQPRVAFLHDWASGDAAPNDSRDGAFDPLFGARRFEFCPTSLYALLARSNLNSPAWRAGIQLGKHGDFFATYRWLYLASARDGWRGTALADPSGHSGKHIGNQLELRLRALLWGPIDLETGYVALSEGPYVERVLQRPARLTSYVHFGLEFRARVRGRR